MLHKDLDVWQKAMLAAKKTYSIAPQLPREETYGIRSQLTRACLSVPCNIAEGMARETSADRAHFLTIARGSVAEANTLFEICDDLDWLPKDETSEILSLLDDVGKMLTAMLRRYRKSR
ncbi:MAG: four helix bundle protein [Caldilineaceae bacterium]|nr:four helix bundle protein [Caldilineaceae bacterium]